MMLMRLLLVWRSIQWAVFLILWLCNCSLIKRPKSPSLLWEKLNMYFSASLKCIYLNLSNIYFSEAGKQFFCDWLIVHWMSDLYPCFNIGYHGDIEWPKAEKSDNDNGKGIIGKDTTSRHAHIWWGECFCQLIFSIATQLLFSIAAPHFFFHSITASISLFLSFLHIFTLRLPDTGI